jgi:hypothetical protein
LDQVWDIRGIADPRAQKLPQPARLFHSQLSNPRVRVLSSQALPPKSTLYLPERIWR